MIVNFIKLELNRVNFNKDKKKFGFFLLFVQPMEFEFWFICYFLTTFSSVNSQKIITYSSKSTIQTVEKAQKHVQI